jgi:hypothetical protein
VMPYGGEPEPPGEAHSRFRGSKCPKYPRA